jgi:hypothetical protein
MGNVMEDEKKCSCGCTCCAPTDDDDRCDDPNCCPDPMDGCGGCVGIICYIGFIYAIWLVIQEFFGMLARF